MNERRFGFVADENDRAVLQRLSDIAELAEKRGRPCFSAFLNEHEQAVAMQHRIISPNDELRFFSGGFDNAQRRVFCALPQHFDINYLNEDDYPFCAVTIIIPKGYELSHRDILGSLMALMIKREAVGDILTGEDMAVVFLLKSAAKLVLEELCKIGRVGVKCLYGAPDILPEAFKTEDCAGVVSSMRLDAIVAMLTGMSRAQCVKAISQGLVSQNAQVSDSVSKEVLVGDKISVRGFGKFLIDDVGGLTKKGRLHVAYKKFI